MIFETENAGQEDTSRAAKFVRIYSSDGKQGRQKKKIWWSWTLSSNRGARYPIITFARGQTLIISDPNGFVAFDFSRDTWLYADQSLRTPSDMMQQVNRFTSQNLHTAGRSIAHRLVDNSSTWRTPIQHTHMDVYLRARTRAGRQMYLVSDTCQPAATQRLDSAAAARAEKQDSRVPSYFHVDFNAVIAESCTNKYCL